MAKDCIPAGPCVVASPHSAVQSLVVSTQDQPLASRDVIQAHRELYQHSVHHLESIQHISGVAPADHSAAQFILLAITLPSHAARCRSRFGNWLSPLQY